MSKDNILGTGHPNKILSSDYALPGPPWTFTVETTVPIDEDRVKEVQQGLGSSDPRRIKDLVTYLTGKVPSGGNDPEAAKKMIAVAFGVDYPFVEAAAASASGRSRHDSEVRAM